MKFNLIVSAIGSLIFALSIAGVYALTGGIWAVVATWVLKVIIGMINIQIGKLKNRRDLHVGVGGDSIPS